jgi:hypothetical protein
MDETFLISIIVALLCVNWMLVGNAWSNDRWR